MNNEENNEIYKVNNNPELNPINLGTINTNVTTVPEVSAGSINQNAVNSGFQSINPVQGFAPIEPNASVNPVQGFAPVEPNASVNPVQGFAPVEPSIPVNPVQPTEPVVTSQIIENIDPLSNNNYANMSNNVISPEPFNGITPQIVLPENESVGEIPPKKKEKKPMNKLVFIVLILSLIMLVAYGIFYFLSINFDKSSIKLNKLTYDINDSLSTDINDYATFENVEIANCSLNTSLVDTTTAGSYVYTITCESKTVDGTITIVDNRDFVVVTTNPVLYKNGELDINSFVVYSTKEDVTYEFVDEDFVLKSLESTGGPYETKAIATDASGVELIISLSYYVIYALYEASSAPILSENMGVDYTIVDSFYINDDINFMGVAYRSYIYTFDQSSYNEIKEKYENESTFDGLVGNLSFDDENYTVTIKISLTSETLDLEYGSEFPISYSVINSYYSSKEYSSNVLFN